MKFLKNGFLLAMLLFTILSCQKEEKTTSITSNELSTNTTNAIQVSNQQLIQTVKDSLAISMFKDLTIDAGYPMWECAYVVLQDSGSHKIVVPYKSGNFNSIENLLIAYRSPTNTCRVKLINKYYYEFMS